MSSFPEPHPLPDLPPVAHSPRAGHPAAGLRQSGVLSYGILPHTLFEVEGSCQEFPFCWLQIHQSFVCELGCPPVALLGSPSSWAAGFNIVHFQHLFFVQICFSPVLSRKLQSTSLAIFFFQLCTSLDFVSWLCFHSQLHLLTLSGHSLFLLTTVKILMCSTYKAFTENTELYEISKTSNVHSLTSRLPVF